MFAIGLFSLFILAMLYIDLHVFHKKSHEISLKEALLWSAFWISLSFLFAFAIYFIKGSEKSLTFLTGYLIEKSLSIDNLFIFLLIFRRFSVPKAYQHKVLFWGIIGALFMRLLFIMGGLALISLFGWMMYLFGAFLIFAGIKLAFEKEKEIHPENNIVIKLFRRFFPITKDYEGDNFFVRKRGVLMATPLFVVLLAIETTDVIFALDSIPAIFAITLDPFIVYTSNIFAILGLRSLYFALEKIMAYFHLLHYALAFILVFIGCKMVLKDFVHIPIPVALGVIVGSISLSIMASYIWPKAR